MPGAPRKNVGSRRATTAKHTKKVAAKPAKKGAGAPAAAKRAAPASRVAQRPARTARATKPAKAKATSPAKRPAKTAKQPAKTAKQPAKTAKQPAKTAKQPAKTAKQPAKTAKQPAKATKPPALVAKKTAPVANVAKASAVGSAIKAPARPTPTLGKAKAAGPRKKTVTCELSGFEVMPGAAALSTKTRDRLRQKLVEEKTRLNLQADELSAEAETLAREREAGDTQFDEESGEGDTVNVERERDLLLSASARSVVDEIDEALVRIKKGSYGVCKYAGRKIPIERLEAIPWANVCVDCKARAERRR